MGRSKINNAQFRSIKVSEPTGFGGMVIRRISEEITFDGSSPVDSAAELLPAGSRILGATYRITETVVGVTNILIGKSGDTDYLWAAQTTYTEGTTGTSLTTIADSRNTSGTEVRVSWTGTSTAGKIRVTVFYIDFETTG